MLFLFLIENVRNTMAREFKEFDDKYYAYKGKFFYYEDTRVLYALAQETAKCFRGDNVAVVHTNADIRHAVYFGEGFEEWQKFRVSLKGCNTAMKLVRLEWRWNYFEAHVGKIDSIGKLEITEELWRLEQIRIDNYIYALRRGGQLNSQFKIAR